MPDVMSGQKVPDRGLTAPPWPDPRSRWGKEEWRDEFLRREVMSSGLS